MIRVTGSWILTILAAIAMILVRPTPSLGLQDSAAQGAGTLVWTVKDLGKHHGQAFKRDDEKLRLFMDSVGEIGTGPGPGDSSLVGWLYRSQPTPAPVVKNVDVGDGATVLVFEDAWVEIEVDDLASTWVVLGHRSQDSLDIPFGRYVRAGNTLEVEMGLASISGEVPVGVGNHEFGIGSKATVLAEPLPFDDHRTRLSRIDSLAEHDPTSMENFIRALQDSLRGSGAAVPSPQSFSVNAYRDMVSRVDSLGVLALRNSDIRFLLPREKDTYRVLNRLSGDRSMRLSEDDRELLEENSRHCVYLHEGQVQFESEQQPETTTTGRLFQIESDGEVRKDVQQCGKSKEWFRNVTVASLSTGTFLFGLSTGATIGALTAVPAAIIAVISITNGGPDPVLPQTGVITIPIPGRN